MATVLAGASQPHLNQELFVGRVSELGQLSACGAKVVAGEPQVVRVEGAAGIGKTSLVTRFVNSLESFTVLAATGDSIESALAYGLIDQLLSRADRQLVQKFPLLAQRPSPTMTPFALGAELLGLIGELHFNGPVAIVVDDLQWSDRPSAQALSFVLRRLSADQVLTVLAVRTPLIDDETSTVTQYLTRHGVRSTTIRLEGLTGRDIQVLSGAVISREVAPLTAARLRAHTGGNPLYVRALLAEASPQILAAMGGILPVPQSLAMVVKTILHRLPAPSRLLVEALAVLDTRCPLARVAQLASIGAPSEALAPALDAGLVQWWPSEPANPIAMRHALHRDAVYELLGPVRRTELHAAAAQLVDSSSAWAHRVAATSTADPLLADQLEEASAQEADTTHHEVAAQYLRWAADLSATRSEYERRLLTACVHTLLTSHPGWAVSIRAEVERCGESPLRSCALGLTALLGTGEPTPAEAWLTRALRSTEAVGGQEWIRGTAAGALSGLQLWRGRSAEAFETSSLALSSAGVPRRLRDFVGVFRAVARSRQDGMHAGLAELTHLPRHSSSVGYADLDCLSCRGALRTMLGQYSAAIEDLSTVVRQQRAGADIMSGPTPLCYLAAAQYALGEWNDSAITAGQAVETQGTSEQPEHYTLTQMAATLVSAGRGDWAVATGHSDSARRRAVELGTPQDLKYAAIAAATIAQARADHIGMRNALLLVDRTHPEYTDSTHTWWNDWWRPLLVEALIGVGELEEAEAELALFKDAAEHISHIEATLSRLRGGLARRRGELDKALNIYCSGVEKHHDEPRLPLPQAMLEHDYGRLLLATGRRREARSWLSHAQRRFVLLAARPFADRVEQDLRASGARTVHDPDNRLPKLTEREEQVSYLVGRGMTNREIAKELYVTAKTVEYHLSNIYAKLGVTSRREMRKVLERG